MTEDYFYFDLKAAIAEFYQQCPALQNKVAIIDPDSVPQWTREQLAEAAVKQVVPDFKMNNKSLRCEYSKIVAKELKDKKPKALFFIYPDWNLEFHFIVLPPSRLEEQDINARLPDIQHLADAEKKVIFQHYSYFLFDHEIGHALDKNFERRLNKKEANITESVADNYAALRHVQRFGAETSYLDRSKHNRVITAVIQSELRHYTVHSLEGTENWLAHNDVTGRSPEELIKIATEIAEESFNPERHKDLSIPLHRDSKKLPLKQRFMRDPHEVAGMRFLMNSEHMNSPYIPQMWQKWYAALAYHGLPKEQVDMLRKKGQDSHGHMKPAERPQKLPKNKQFM